MTKLAAYLAYARKTLVSLVGILGVVVSLNVLHGQAQTIVATAASILTSVLVYVTPNGAKTADVPVPSTAAAPVTGVQNVTLDVQPVL